MKTHTPTSEIELIHRLYVTKKLTAHEISEKTGLSPTTIYRRLRAGGVDVRSRGPMVPGRNSEPIIWSANMAYAVGLFAADGCMYKDGRHLELTSKDLEQIKNFQKALGTYGTISTKCSGHNDRRYFRTQFSNVCLYRFLESAGLVPNKSLTLGPIKLPDQYLPDFVRGHLDGDGCVTATSSGQYTNTAMFRTIFASYSPKFLDWIQASIEKSIGIRGFINGRKLVYARSDSQRLWKWIYQDDSAIRLSRKWNVVQRFIDITVDRKSTRHDYLNRLE